MDCQFAHATGFSPAFDDQDTVDQLARGYCSLIGGAGR